MLRLALAALSLSIGINNINIASELLENLNTTLSTLQHQISRL